MGEVRQTVGEAAITRLARHGVDTVFGIPGVHTLPLYRGLAATSIRHVTPRHEQGGGFMADGYARAGGRPGVCLLTSGPGVTNAATPLAEAYSDSSPVLVLSSVNARADLGLALGRLHELQSQSAAMAPLVGWSRSALAPSAVPGLIDRAFASFAAQRPRPVHIEVPLDVLDAEAATVAFGPIPSRPGPAPDAIERAARLAAAAERPVLLLGGGAVDAGKAALALARRIGAVVVTTTAGSGVVPADDPLSIGATLATAAGREALAAADLVIAAGTELAETDHWTERLPISAPLVRIDIDLAELTDRHAELAMISDAGLALAALAEAVPRKGGRAAAAAERAALFRQRIAAALEASVADRLALVGALRAGLPRDAILATDMTKLAYTANVAFPSYGPRSYFHPCGYGTLGFALPAAIGAGLACPDRPVAALMGDGGLQFTLGELASAAETGRQLTLVVYDNAGYGMIRDGMIRANIAPVGVDPSGPALDHLAKAYGAGYVAADSAGALKKAVAGSIAHRGVTIVHVRAPL
jgi:thiamine pyrophosphate-dependent acetolactate synthase large subunit-like protein